MPARGPAPDLGQQIRQERTVDLEIVLAPRQCQRQEIALGGAVLQGDIGGEQQEALTAGLRQLADALRRGRHDRLVLGAEPALMAEIGGQGLVDDAVDPLAVAALALDDVPAVAEHEGLELGERFRIRLRQGCEARGIGEGEPIKSIGRQGQQIGQGADRRKLRGAGELDGDLALLRRQVELDGLRRARQVEHAQHHVVIMLAQIGQHLAVARAQEGQVAVAEGVMGLAHGDHALGPVEQRAGVSLLRFDVDGLVAVDRVHDRRQEETLGVGAGEAAIAVGGPLHGRAHAVAVAEIEIVAHAELVAVIEHRRAGHGQQQAGQQLDLAAVVVEQRRQAPSDAEIEPRPAVGGVGLPQIVALGVGHHLEGQLVVVAQEDRPLAFLGDRRRLADDVGDGIAVLARQAHEDARHQREVERHVALVAVAEIRAGVLGPLIGLGQQHAVRIALVELLAEALQDLVALGQVLVVGAVALDQIRHRVEPQPVDAHVEPEAQDAHDVGENAGVVVVEVGLVRIEPVPEIGLGDRVPGPVRGLGVEKDDARAGIFLVGVAPHIIIAPHGAGFGRARPLEPGVLVGGVVDHELGDDADATGVRRRHEAAEVAHGAVGGIDRGVVGDVVAVVAQRRGVERQQPDGGDAELVQIIELLHQAGEIPDPVIVGIEERLDVQLVDDGVLVPEPVVTIDHGRSKGLERRAITC